MWRPATLGRDVDYAPADPGHEYLPGFTESFFGPLAVEWGIYGVRSTRTLRANLYRGMTPDGTRQLLTRLDFEKYRPVVGGNFHATLSLDAWLASQPEAVRNRAERLFAQAAREVADRILEQLTDRGRSGAPAGETPVKTLATLYLHKTNSIGHYHLHALLEIHNLGLRPDGTYRALDNSPLFDGQGMFSVEFAARLRHLLYREFGLVTKFTEKGLEVEGLEALRGLKTPRREQMEREIAEKGLPVTPKTLHWAGMKTHAARDTALTVGAAVSRFLGWLRTKLAEKVTTRSEGVRTTSLLREQRKADDAVRAAAKAVSRGGTHVSDQQLGNLALYAGLQTGVDPKLLDSALASAAQDPARFGLTLLPNGSYSTTKVEKSRARWGRAVTRLRELKPIPPSEAAMSVARVRHSSMPTHHFEYAVTVAWSRGFVASAPQPGLVLVADAFRAAHRTVHIVSATQTKREMQAAFQTPVGDVHAFAQRLGKPPWRDAMREVSRKKAWTIRAVYREWCRARRPKVRLTRRDLVVVDARYASHHAVRDILCVARAAGATVHMISELPVLTRAREHSANQDRDR